MAYRTVLIGCGNIGSGTDLDFTQKKIRSHASAYSACEDISLVAVCDQNLSVAKLTATRWNVPNFYTNPKELLERESPQIVSICTPNETHAELLQLAVNTPSVRAILAEKPFVSKSSEGKQILEMARQRGITLLVNYTRRYSPTHQKIQTLIRSGEIGTIQTIQGYYTKGLLHNGTHWIDLALWMIGEIHSVQGFRLRNESIADAQVDVLFQFQNGATGFLQGLEATAFSLFEMDIIGTKGRVRISDSGHQIDFYEVAPSPHYVGYQTLLPTKRLDGEMELPLRYAAEDLVNCLKTGDSPRCSGEDGLKAVVLAEKIFQSARAL